MRCRGGMKSEVERAPLEETTLEDSVTSKSTRSHWSSKPKVQPLMEREVEGWDL